MLHVRRSGARGHADYGWLDTRYTFSFADYRDPEHMGFGRLRVINEDRIAPHTGFGTHPHRDMEIVSYVVSGALEHRDTAGHGGVLRPGDVQVMSAGRGIAHSERNAAGDPLHLLQIWLLPRRTGTAPRYAQRHFPEAPVTLLVSPDGAGGSLPVDQDARIWRLLLPEGDARTVELEGRRAWLQIVRGVVVVDDIRLEAGDGAAITEATTLSLSTPDGVEALLFDLESR